MSCGHGSALMTPHERGPGQPGLALWP
jgi:hypothetical protein